MNNLFSELGFGGGGACIHTILMLIGKTMLKDGFLAFSGTPPACVKCHYAVSNPKITASLEVLRQVKTQSFLLHLDMALSTEYI